MAKTLKFALSALALVNAQKPRDDVQHAYNTVLEGLRQVLRSCREAGGAANTALHLSHSTHTHRDSRVTRNLVKVLQCF